MLVSLALFHNRLAAVFTSADTFALYQVQDMQACHLTTLPAAPGGIAEQAEVLRENGVTLLVCGALCGCDRRVLRQAGIEVVAWICGATQDVVQALCLDQLESLRMPGCAPQHCRNAGYGFAQDSEPTTQENAEQHQAPLRHGGPGAKRRRYTMGGAYGTPSVLQANEHSAEKTLHPTTPASLSVVIQPPPARAGENTPSVPPPAKQPSPAPLREHPLTVHGDES